MTSNVNDEAELRHWLVDYLVTTIGCNPEVIDPGLALNELGVGSRDAVVLSGELSELLGRPVSPVEFWQHPTVNELAAFLTTPEAESAPDVETAGVQRGPSDDPIAVIGLGCRLPGGVTGPEALWQFLCDGRSAIGEVSPDRWQTFDDGSPETAAALAKTTRWGAFLTELDAFDAEYFDISPSEAARIDPQQRLLLEVACEALEHAGIPANSLRRTQTGVFAGACISEYGYLALRDLSRVDAWTGTGGALSIIANRLSYFLDVRGPSMAVDTACSSSLVAIHLACQSLRSGESQLAIAAGVNVLLSPAVTRTFDQADAMSPTGRCHAFDAAADGFVRGEGCGAVVLKRLVDAQRDGDRVLAVVRGSAVNQDGRSNGLMAPNPAAQIAVLHAACANAGIQPREVDYVEAHGTGTLLGDPIEARALGTVFGKGRPGSAPLLIGSVKTNLGHLEAAAGVAGFIKAVLAVQRGRIPKNLHFESPNPHIPFDAMRLKVVAEHHDWPSTGRKRRAGVSSFGFGGTNAHLVLEQPPEVAAVPAAPAAPAVNTLVVSGKTPGRVAAMARELADWMVGPGAGVALPEVAHTMNHHRSRHALFATVCAADREQAVEGLTAVAAGLPAAGVVLPHAGPCGPGVVFVYSGQGSQWAGMGRRLLSEEPAFAAAVAELDPVFVEQVGFSLAKVLSGGMAVAGIDRIQPVLVGVQLALTELWRSYGVEPDAVVGHSMGEVSAAVVARALSVADGLRVIATRSRLMARLAGEGAMALLELDAAHAQEVIAAHPNVSVAVYASPRQTVIAGPPEQVDAVVAAVAEQDRLASRIEVDVASHHQIVDPILPELLGALDDLVPSAPTMPVISTTWSAAPGGPLFDAQYWAANLRNPVRFSDAIATAAAAEHTTFIEISPHPLLTHAITETLGDAHHHSLGTLQRDTNDTLTFHTNLNTTHTTHPPHTVHPPEPHASLPTTSWHHTHHWISGGHRDDLRGSAPKTGTLLGAHLVVSSTPATHLWQARLLPEAKPYPGYHRLHGLEVVPVSVLLHTLLVAAAEVGATGLSSVRFEHPITLDRPKRIQVLADSETLSIASCSAADASADRWTRHVTARLSRSVPDSTADVGPVCGPADQRPPDAVDPSVVDQLRPQGVEGQPFGWSIESYTSSSTGLEARVHLTDESVEHPTVALLDAATQLAAWAGVTDSRLYLPAAVEQVWLQGAVTGTSATVSARCTGLDADEVTVDVDACGGTAGAGIALRSLRYVALEHGEQPARGSVDPRMFAHTIEWQPRPGETHGGTGTVAVIGSETPSTGELREGLAGAGHPAVEVAEARYVLYVADSRPADGTGTDIDSTARMSAQLTELVRALADRADRDPVTLWVLTTGVHEAASAAAVRQSPLWGLAGVIAAEHPEIWGGLVDLAPDDDIAEAAALADTLGTPSKTVLLLRDGTFLVPELVPVSGEPANEPVRCRPDVAYLVTGGLGALGLLMAAWLADRGARRLLLAGRTPLPPRRDWDDPSCDAQTRHRITAIRDLERRGVSVEVVTLDIGSADQLRALLTERDRIGAPPIRGIIHAAGVTGDQLLTSTSHDSMRRVMWPKVGGAQVLHEAFPCGSVDFFYLTASAGSIFGIPGQGSYAAANAYLDAVARARHRNGCHTLSLDWAAWRGLGFATGAELVAQELRRLGSRELEPDEAFAAWEYVDGHDVAQVVVVPTSAAVGEDLPQATDALTADTAAAWARLPLDDIREKLTAEIRTVLARELHTAESELETDRPFIDLGLNSMMALSIRRDIERIVGLELSATMLWNHPTVQSLAAHLSAKLRPSEQDPVETVTPSSEGSGSVLDSLFDRVESTAAGTETGPR